MTILKKQDDKTLCLALAGHLDTLSAPQLEAELKASLDGADSLVLDLADLDYVSSAGLRVLLSAHKRMSCKGGMKVKNVNEVVAEVFAVTGFDGILDIE